MDISVVVCCHNDGRFLPDALDSLYQQTLAPERYEVILIDDGSTDQTQDVAARYRHHGNFRSITQSNQGLPAACNRGLREARGAYVIRLDADDRFEPDILATMQPLLDDGSTDFVYSDRYEQVLGGPRQYVSTAPFSLFKLIAIGTMMRRTLLLRVGGYRELFWEEFDLYARYLSATPKPARHVARPLLTYSVKRPGSLMSDADARQKGCEELKRLWPAHLWERFGPMPHELVAVSCELPR